MRPLHRRRLQLPRGRDPFPEPDNARKRVDHLKAASRWPRNQQPAIIGAEIEGGIGAVALALRWRWPVPVRRRDKPSGRGGCVEIV
jgi:hypothetical protein